MGGGETSGETLGGHPTTRQRLWCGPTAKVLLKKRKHREVSSNSREGNLAGCRRGIGRVVGYLKRLDSKPTSNRGGGRETPSTGQGTAKKEKRGGFFKQRIDCNRGNDAHSIVNKSNKAEKNLRSGAHNALAFLMAKRAGAFGERV